MSCTLKAKYIKKLKASSPVNICQSCNITIPTLLLATVGIRDEAVEFAQGVTFEVLIGSALITPASV